MNTKEYTAAALRTKSDKFYPPTPDNWTDKPATTHLTVDVLHAIIGISTEGGELLDVVKKALFYGCAVDPVNLDEEIGDVLWYVAIYCNARHIDMETLMATNAAKLRARFPACFTEEAANSRDLTAERAVLEAQEREHVKRAVVAADAELAKLNDGMRVGGGTHGTVFNRANSFDDRMKP